MSRVFFDTNIFIYLFEESPEFVDRVARLLERMAERNDELITSTFTFGELLVKPLERNEAALVARYEAVLRHPEIRVVPFDATAARRYAEIRQDRSIRAPDAIQLACASVAACDLFITNDEPLTRKVVPGIQFIVTLSRAPI